MPRDPTTSYKEHTQIALEELLWEEIVIENDFSALSYFKKSIY